MANSKLEEGGAYRSMAEKFRKENGLFLHEGFLLMPEVRHTPTQLKRVKSFQFDEKDILISTYPRSGTTWIQEIIWLVCNEADVETAKRVDLDERSRFIEIKWNRNDKPEIDHLETTPSPRIIKTHFTPQFFENSQKARFKTVVVMRNLKDVLVSHFHFYQDLFDFKGTWDDFFEMFKQDTMIWGSWVNHCLTCWKLRNDPNVLVLKYEDMKKDPKSETIKVAEFCEKSLTEDQVKLIVDHTFFDNMKSMLSKSKRSKKINFIRKGTVGGWQDCFREEQLRYVAELLKETTEKEGLVFED